VAEGEVGNGEMQDLGKIRGELATFTHAITLFLNLLSIGSQGKVERYMDEHGEELREIKHSLHWVTASMQANSHGEESVLTSYAGYENAVWKAFRRELIKEGFSSSVLEKHRKTIKGYVMELEHRGALDEMPDEPDPGIGSCTCAESEDGPEFEVTTIKPIIEGDSDNHDNNADIDEPEDLSPSTSVDPPIIDDGPADDESCSDQGAETPTPQPESVAMEIRFTTSLKAYQASAEDVDDEDLFPGAHPNCWIASDEDYLGTDNLFHASESFRKFKHVLGKLYLEDCSDEDPFDEQKAQQRHREAVDQTKRGCSPLSNDHSRAPAWTSLEEVSDAESLWRSASELALECYNKKLHRKKGQESQNCSLKEGRPL
jgi:hypothetical protein